MSHLYFCRPFPVIAQCGIIRKGIKMKYIYLYLIGIVSGLLTWCMQYILKKSNRHKNRAIVEDTCLADNNNIDDSPLGGMPNISMLPSSVYKITSNKVRFVAFVIFIVLIVGAFLNTKYDLWAGVKPVIVSITNIAKSVATYVLGLCTPYLSERVTKKLKKARKKLKRRKRKSE